MNNDIILQGLTQEDIGFEGIFDGSQLTIPEGTELKCMLTDIFIGYKESAGLSVCEPTFTVIEPSPFQGQSYKYKLKIYDLDTKKRDLAMRNLSVIDYQAGFVMTKNSLPVSTDNAFQYWVNKCVVRAKFGLLVTDDGREINFVRGLGYARDDIFNPNAQDIARSNTPYQDTTQPF